jgi:hypothetical protein
MSSTFDESQITSSITYKCITRLDAYNEISSWKMMPILTYTPPTALITSVVANNTYYLEYTILFNGVPIIPRTPVVNGVNFWFGSILPYNVNYIPSDLQLVFYSPVQHILNVETTIITFNYSYYVSLLESSNLTFTDSTLGVTCTLNAGAVTLAPITPLDSSTLSNAVSKMYFVSGQQLYEDLSTMSGLGLFEFRYFTTIYVTDQDPIYTGTMVIDPKVDVIKTLFIQTKSCNLTNASIVVSYQPQSNVITSLTNIAATVSFSEGQYLNFNTPNTYQLILNVDKSSIAQQDFLTDLSSIEIYAYGGFLDADTKAANAGNLYISLT